MAPRRRVLADHKKVGQRFIPPVVQALPQMGEVSYGRKILPESLWIAVLMAAMGRLEGTRLSVDVARAAAAQRPSGHFGFCSGYADLDADQRAAAVGALERRHEASQALAPLVSLYPECPLAYVCLPEHLDGRDQEEDVALLRGLLPELFDRLSSEATAMQAGVVYLEFVTDRLKVAEDTSLAKFPEIERYPDTEISRQVAAAVRAFLNGIGGGMIPKDDRWPRYFWNRGLELAPCEVWR